MKNTLSLHRIKHDANGMLNAKRQSKLLFRNKTSKFTLKLTDGFYVQYKIFISAYNIKTI